MPNNNVRKIGWSTDQCCGVKKWHVFVWVICSTVGERFEAKDTDQKIRMHITQIRIMWMINSGDDRCCFAGTYVSSRKMGRQTDECSKVIVGSSIRSIELRKYGNTTPWFAGLPHFSKILLSTTECRSPMVERNDWCCLLQKGRHNKSGRQNKELFSITQKKKNFEWWYYKTIN